MAKTWLSIRPAVELCDEDYWRDDIIQENVIPRSSSKPRTNGAEKPDVEEALESASPLFDPFTRALDTYAFESVEWLWPGWIVKHAVNMLDGDPGILKTYVAIHIAACITRGVPLEGMDERDAVQGNVLYLSTEDRPETALGPRFHAAGADLSAISVLDSSRRVDDGEGNKTPYFFSLSDMDMLRAEIKAKNPALIVLDPIMGVLPEDTNPNDETDIRPLMWELGCLCEELNTTILGIRHCKKGESSSALMAGGGSIGMSASVRSNLFMAKHPDDPEVSVLAVSKSNYSRIPMSLACHIEEGFFKWLGPVKLTADDLNRARNNRGKLKRVSCKDWLLSRLESGHEKKKSLRREGKTLGFSARTLERAMKQLVEEGLTKSYGSSQRKIWSLA